MKEEGKNNNRSLFTIFALNSTIMKKDINQIITLINPVLIRYGIHSASIAGSMACGDHTDESDLDLIVEIDKPMSLLRFAALKIELEELIQLKVDLMERSAIKPRLRQSLLSNERIIHC